MRSLSLAALVLSVLTVCPVAAQTPAREALTPWVLHVSPVVDLPVADPHRLFSLSSGGQLGVAYRPKEFGGWEVGSTVGYGVGTLRSELTSLATTVSETSLGVAGAFTWSLLPSLSARAFGGAALVFGTLSGDSTGALYASAEAGLGLDWALSPQWSARAGASWLQKLGLYGGLQSSLAVAWTIPEPKANSYGPAGPRLRLLQFSETRLGSVFPILQTYYDDHPIGTIRITNVGTEAATDVKVSFVLRQYMDAAKDCLTLPQLSPGESRDVPLFALFRNNILDVTEATKAAGEVTVEYTTSQGLQTQTSNASLRVYDRNAMTWDDDRKAAAFVSGKDPWVLEVSNTLTASVKDLRNEGLNKNLQTALAFHNGLRLYGLSYVVNPKSPFARAFANPEFIDFLKFPRQTLAYKAGDCSDLSILYASLFESVGIETAFITVPGHIFMALNLEVPPEAAPSTLGHTEDLIFLEGKTWMPLEVTMRDASLLEIWREGAREWREGRQAGTAGFYPIHEAWKTYPPVGLPADNTNPDSLTRTRVSQSFLADLVPLVDQELARRIGPLNAALKADPSPKAYNARGVLYARFNRLTEAEKDFRLATAKTPYAPALINLGNVAFLKQDNLAALAAYQKAAPLVPGNARLQLNLARAAQALGKTSEAAQALAVAQKLDPDLTARYSPGASATEGNRAAEQGARAPLWDEESRS